MPKNSSVQHSKTPEKTWLSKEIFILIILATLAILLWNAWKIINIPSAGIRLDRENRVINIKHGSPAEKAGMRQGDIIKSVNGIPIIQRSPFIGLTPGETSIFTIDREGRQLLMVITPTAKPWQTRIINLEPLFIGLVFWLSTILIWGMLKKTSVERIFIILSQATALMFATGIASSIDKNSPGNFSFTILLLIVTPLTIHFYFSFPQKKDGVINSITLKASYILAAFFIVIRLIKHLMADSNAWLDFIDAQRVIFTSLVLIVALGSVFSARNKHTIRSRRQQRVLIVGMAFSLLPLLLLSLLPDLLHWKTSIKYIWTFPFLMLLPISYVYAIRKESLSIFDLVLKKALSYTIIGGVLISLYLILSTLLSFLSLGVSISHVIAGVIMTVLAITWLEPFKRRTSIWLDQSFYGNWYDYRSIIQQNSQYLSEALHLDELADRLLHHVQTMRFVEGALLWAEDGAFTVHSYFGYTPEIVAQFKLSVDHPVAKRLTRHKFPRMQDRIITPQEIKALPPARQKLIKELRVQILIPLLTGRDNLQGILVLGRRYPNESLDKEDWDILNTMAHQTSLAAKNIHLVKKLRSQLNIMQEMQQELKETKWRLAENSERERLELAQLLHDGPIQDIYSVAYQLAIWRKINMKENDEDLRLIEADLMDIEQELRYFSTELRPPALDSFGLEGAIRSHIHKLQEANTDIEIVADIDPIAGITTQTENLALFRVYQEAVQNAIRHARADKIWVSIHVEHNHVIMQIKDNGRGFVVPKKWIDFARQGHLGILGMTERVEAIGGQLDVTSGIKQGTTIRITLPIQTLDSISMDV